MGSILREIEDIISLDLFSTESTDQKLSSADKKEAKQYISSTSLITI
ncbi:hypothetical protein KQR56_18335 [Bacillus velezensis]|nr:hypothetical protein [Bacillus velezensis]